MSILPKMMNYSFKISALLSLEFAQLPDSHTIQGFLLFCRGIAVLKSVISFVSNKKQVCGTSCKGKELRREEGVVVAVVGRRASLFTVISPQKKKKKLRINPRNRFRLKVADTKLFLFAIRQLSSNVWDDTASILFIDYQQETLSMLTMCATYKSPCCCCCCCCLFFLTSSLSQKRGRMLTRK